MHWVINEQSVYYDLGHSGLVISLFFQSIFLSHEADKYKRNPIERIFIYKRHFI